MDDRQSEVHKLENNFPFYLPVMWNKYVASVTKPLDVMKIRIQMKNELSTKEHMQIGTFKGREYEGWIKNAVPKVEEEWIGDLYKGLLGTLLREGIYTSIRLGAYEPMKLALGATNPAHTPFSKKICAAAISGAIGSSIATPTDLIKVRIETDSQASTYRSTLSAFKTVTKNKGVRGLYIGLGPTVQRATIFTATQIPSYDHAKHTILNAGWMVEGPTLHIVSSMIAGFMTALTTLPVDVIKTRIVHINIGGQHTKAYTSTADFLWKIVRTEGPLSLFKGLYPIG